MTLSRVTHRHVEQACQRYNKARDLTYPSRGYLQWADIRGDGSNRRGLYVTVTDSGGVTSSNLRGKTMRETIANIELAIRMVRSPDFAVIINAIHERGARQVAALSELSARGLWLSAEQRKQAGLA
jgi:hypothetical protein